MVCFSILLGFSLKQNDQLNFKMDFGAMKLENIGVLKPKFSYSFNKLVQANDVAIKLKLHKESNQYQISCYFHHLPCLEFQD